MKFCSQCGDSLVRRVPRDDDRQRHVCPGCGEVHYQNPKIVTGCLPIWRDSVLLCRRAIEPRKGFWTVPAGFMELDETVEQGAIREDHSWNTADEGSGADIEGDMTVSEPSTTNMLAVVTIGFTAIHNHMQHELLGEQAAPGRSV